MENKSLTVILKSALLVIGIPIVLYFTLLSLLIIIPTFQTHTVYLHRITLTWFRDLNIPEIFGFLHSQVTPFYIIIADGRPDSYRTLSSGSPNKIHILTFDYRSYGLSTGAPSEEGLLLDAIAVMEWAMETAGIPPSRIVIFGQSLGTALAIALARHYILQASPQVSFAGMVLVAPFSDVAALTATYRIGGVVPVLSPLAWFPPLLKFFQKFLTSTWMSKDRIAEFVGNAEKGEGGGGGGGGSSPYHITFIHAEDDADIPCSHTDVLTWYAVSATTSSGISYEEFERERETRKVNLGNAGWFVEWRTGGSGIIRQEIVKYGLHDKIMSYSVVGMAVVRAFQSSAPGL
ncbi:hypothetical protein AJ79_10297 [Helicocarpus griseus UAMH5409]|uniref:AB hydrolase-1 domain-containing protein n=1 Tax=Helicocarpus griseus UAMH5409 TaxID=1447875 RepID=A0A2B7WEL0_9EURO|nr:hypothetical protein AJ79_10297 [Helicocarpus griseus UAMH5409]